MTEPSKLENKAKKARAARKQLKKTEPASHETPEEVRPEPAATAEPETMDAYVKRVSEELGVKSKLFTAKHPQAAPTPFHALLLVLVRRVAELEWRLEHAPTRD